MKWTPRLLEQFEQQVAKEFEEGRINTPIHLSGGNEGYLIGLFELIKPQDWVVSTHRNHYHYLLKGGSPERLMAEIRGEADGCCGGKGRSMHIFDKSINFISTAIVGGGPAIACGIGLAINKEWKGKGGEKPHVWCFIGDGGEDSGHLVEASRFALGRELPVTFVIEDNNLAVEATKEERWKAHPKYEAPNVIRYLYQRKYPHVGIGKYVSF